MRHRDGMSTGAMRGRSVDADGTPGITARYPRRPRYLRTNDNIPEIDIRLRRNSRCFKARTTGTSRRMPSRSNTIGHTGCKVLLRHLSRALQRRYEDNHHKREAEKCRGPPSPRRLRNPKPRRRRPPLPSPRRRNTKPKRRRPLSPRRLHRNQGPRPRRPPSPSPRRRNTEPNRRRPPLPSLRRRNTEPNRRRPPLPSLRRRNTKPKCRRPLSPRRLHRSLRPRLRSRPSPRRPRRNQRSPTRTKRPRRNQRRPTRRVRDLIEAIRACHQWRGRTVIESRLQPELAATAELLLRAPSRSSD